jgi:hypothetical protein
LLDRKPSKEVIVPVRFRIRFQALVQEVGDRCWKDSTSENEETGEGVPTDLYQYISYQDELYWLALFDAYVESASKFEKDGTECGYEDYLPSSVWKKAMLGVYCPFGPQGNLQSGYRLLKLADWINELIPPKSEFERDEFNR